MSPTPSSAPLPPPIAPPRRPDDTVAVCQAAAELLTSPATCLDLIERVLRSEDRLRLGTAVAMVSTSALRPGLQQTGIARLVDLVTRAALDAAREQLIREAEARVAAWRTGVAR